MHVAHCALHVACCALCAPCTCSLSIAKACHSVSFGCFRMCAPHVLWVYVCGVRFALDVSGVCVVHAYRCGWWVSMFVCVYLYVFAGSAPECIYASVCLCMHTCECVRCTHSCIVRVVHVVCSFCVCAMDMSVCRVCPVCAYLCLCKFASAPTGAARTPAPCCWWRPRGSGTGRTPGSPARTASSEPIPNKPKQLRGAAAAEVMVVAVRAGSKVCEGGKPGS